VSGSPSSGATAIGSSPGRSSLPRLPAIDIARGIAIVGMVIYHTAFDLYAEGLIAVDVDNDLYWKVFARSVAGAFLVLVGVGLVLAGRRGIDWPRYWRRVAFIAAGAAAVSLATWFFDSGTFVYFGILHEIAVASVLALPFLAAPWWLIAPLAAAIIAAPWFLTNPVFDTPALWWLGLSTDVRATLDYVPLLPWFGVVLAGILIGRLIVRHAAAIATWRLADPLARLLRLAGRWSLVIYLVHQPLIYGLVHLAAITFPPGPALVRAHFVSECRAAVCHSAEASCVGYCGCLFDSLYGTDLYPPRRAEDLSADQASRQHGIVAECHAEWP